MPELTPTGAVDVVQRQVRRVRRRKNLYELQRALYLIIAAGAGAATIVLPLALFAPPDVFAIATGSTLAILTGITLFLIGAARRRWLARQSAVAWIETHAALAGRVRTLLELAARPVGAPGFFHALLVSQIGHDLGAWTPRRLVPRGVPRLALAAAVVATAVLAIVLRLASLAAPAVPTVTFSDQPLAGEHPSGAAESMTGERVVVAPGMPQESSGQSAQASNGTDADDSSLASLPSALQENVRRQVWGKAWERVRDALARAETSRGSNARQDTTTDDDDQTDSEDTDEREMARAPSGEIPHRRRPGVGRQPVGQSGSTPEDPAASTNEQAQSDEQSERESGASGGGAGNGISPGDLFGAASDDTVPANGSFELSLAARMRADRAGKRSGGPAPDADPDAQPALAADQRRESATHRMTVPAAYETVVREVFAHRRPESEQP